LQDGNSAARSCAAALARRQFAAFRADASTHEHPPLSIATVHAGLTLNAGIDAAWLFDRAEQRAVKVDGTFA
jgi:hypothetical protein